MSSGAEDQVDLPTISLDPTFLGALGRTLDEKILAQYHATDTAINQIYQPAAGVKAVIKSIIISNSDASTQNYAVYLDKDGGVSPTFDETTSLIPNGDILAEEAALINPLFWPMTENDALAFEASVANKVTITVFGVEITES